ncbi:hypothetical protein CTI12_AA257590 [Artemisia annua]|uniref:Uncharacterized protein n=1 Tax=Artemisia annua TaxID=35608 RepID=A0A2U1NJX4_ARTAN|nr:hypothetical protein CTI12_AA257590 [Artemisia annua]
MDYFDNLCKKNGLPNKETPLPLKQSNCGSLDQHRFARKKLWIVDEAPPPLSAKSSDAGSFIDLLLEPSEEDLKIWPHML